MRQFVLTAASALLFSGAAMAADISAPVKAPAPAPTPVWDLTWGVTGATDFVFRGMSQTNGNANIQGFAELSLFDWFYVGAWSGNVSFLDSGSAEVDVYAGLRHTWGAFTADVGYIGYLYPGSSLDTDLNSWEVYLKTAYDVSSWLNIGVHLFHSTNYSATSSDGTYLAGLATITLPSFGPNDSIGWFLSGEFGYQWTDSGIWNAIFNDGLSIGPRYVDISGYSSWNAGVGFTYRAATLDLRYHGSELNDDQCFLMIANRKSCGDRFMAALSFNGSLNESK